MDAIRTLDEAPDIESAIKYLYGNHLYTDFQFISPDGLERYDVHKLIIQIHSYKLAEIIKETSSLDGSLSSLSQNELRIENVDKLALRNMIRFFYSDRLVLQNMDDICKTKAIAEKFDITGLIQECKRKLCDINVTVSNVLRVIQAAEEFGNEAKQNECLNLIGENQETVFNDQLFAKMPFKKVLDIFVKLKESQMMTEAAFLLSAIIWLETNKSVKNKGLLMEKVTISNISMDEYLDIIISHPSFFEKTEITAIVKEIKSRQIIINPGAVQEVKDTVQHTRVRANTETQTTAAQYTHVGTNTETQTTAASVEKDSKIEKRKLLTIRILDDIDGANAFNLEKRARITIQDSCGTRSLQVGISEVLKKGLLGTVTKEKTLSDVDISYTGLYFMIRSLSELEDTLTSLQYVEVLKAAIVFQLDGLRQKCNTIIDGHLDYDPLFLDQLRKLPHFKDKCLSILLAEPLRVLLHPNFIECSGDLIMLILEQNELKVVSETQLLLVAISWLEAQNKHRQHFRDYILKKLAFEKIPTPDFKYAIFHYPDFFTQKEQEYILAYRNAVGSEIRFFREKLPPWYNFKSRKIT